MTTEGDLRLLANELGGNITGIPHGLSDEDHLRICKAHEVAGVREFSFFHDEMGNAQEFSRRVEAGRDVVTHVEIIVRVIPHQRGRGGGQQT